MNQLLNLQMFILNMGEGHFILKNRQMTLLIKKTTINNPSPTANTILYTLYTLYNKRFTHIYRH